MNKVAIYTLTSALHDEQAIAAVTREFLGTLDMPFDLQGTDYEDYGSHVLSLIYVRTGGTESILRTILPNLVRQSDQPVYLLTSGKSNSLAASMEILSYLRQNRIEGEIIHGTREYINDRIRLLVQITEARHRLEDIRLGVIGKPSDWLISSNANYIRVREQLGITLLDISLDEVREAYDRLDNRTDAALEAMAPTPAIREALPGALRIYDAIREVAERYQLSGLTIRCFDLLTALHNTGCIALARLNSEGLVAGCEGDVPAMLSMQIARAALGVSGFQANPARINPETGEILFAHCTIPLDMVERYELDTHFESGIGVGIRGYMRPGDVTIFKVSGDLRRTFIAEGTLVRNQGEPDLCRTQQVIQLSDPSQARYFLTDPIGNHHIILPGHVGELLRGILGE